MTPEQLVAKWQPVLNAGAHIWTWSEPASLAYWAEQASKAKNIVEIGTHLGRSAKTMLLANPQCELWCIDMWYEPGTYETAQHMLKDEIAAGRCHLIKSMSDYAAEVLERMDPFLDFVMVDDGHEEKDIYRDVNSFWGLLKENCVMCGHDYDRNNPNDGVTKGVRNLFAHYTEPVPRVWSVIKKEGTRK
jgi:predicted O-methyltransferase YrrM